MEKNPAACIMDWSIELEKGLRSKKPGASIEAILTIGDKLKQWNIVPQLSTAAHNMFGLMPREDRLFANAILYRLTEAFRFGDRPIRRAVVKVFLSEFRCRNEKRRRYNGFLSNSMVDNPLELLTRVKMVFDTGDAESRSFCLVLFGCWADFANDNADIRYTILSSLVSSNVLEAKASLFAAGCFCELLDDFAYVVLEILIDIVTSPKTAHAVRLAGVRAFSRINYSSSVADRAFKMGEKLVSEFSEDDLLAAMMISLSKLASRWPLLISKQMESLFSYLTIGTSLIVQTTALRCIRNILAKGVCQFLVGAHMVKALFCLLDQPQISSCMQCEVLWILHKMLLYPNVLRNNMVEVPKLLMIIENASRSPFMTSRQLALRIYVSVAGKLTESSKMGCAGVCSDSLPSRAVTLIIDQLTLVLKQVSNCDHSQVMHEAKYLLNLLICLLQEHPGLCVLVLDNIYLSVKDMITVYVLPTMKPCSLGHEIMDYTVNKTTSTRFQLPIAIHKFMVAFLGILNETGTSSMEIFQKMKLLVRLVHECSSFDWYIHTLYSLLLQSYIVWYYVPTENSETCKNEKYLCRSNLDEQENLSVVYVKKMLQNDNWPAYKTVICAACQGSWLMANFVFEKLTSKVQSNSCYRWLKFLAQFAHTEREFQLFLLPKVSSNLENLIEPEDKKTTIMYSGHIVSAYSSICSLREALEALTAPSEAFYFQKWFSNIRLKVHETVLDILEIVGSFSSHPDKNAVQSSEKSQRVNLVSSLTRRSHCLRRLARQFDLIVTSFVGMDRKSSGVISALALSCAVLACVTGFAGLIFNVSPSEITTETSLEKSDNISLAILIENLIMRLRHVDHEICTKLKMLLKHTGEPKRCVQLLSRNQISMGGSEVREILRVLSYAVTGVIHLRRKASTLPDQDLLCQYTEEGLQLLSDVIRKWTHIPFRTPKSFFQLRPYPGSELFAISSDLRNTDSISILPGFHLSLNLCLQVKHLPSDFQINRTKLYCILYCKMSASLSKQNKGQAWFGHPDRDVDDMVDLNDKLLKYATNCEKKTCLKHLTNTDKDDGAALAYIRFEVNERGQGFSTCLLDVSGFPAGAYEIGWFSCCIDCRGLYWSLLPLNAGPIFTVQN